MVLFKKAFFIFTAKLCDKCFQNYLVDIMLITVTYAHKIRY